MDINPAQVDLPKESNPLPTDETSIDNSSFVDPTLVNTTANSHSSKKILLLLAISVFVIFIIGVSSYSLNLLNIAGDHTKIAQNGNSQIQETSNRTADIPTPNDSTLLTAAPTSSNSELLTYTSQKANISFTYPKSWPITEVPADCGPCIERLVFASSFDVSKQDPEKGYIPANAYAFVNILKMNIYKSFEAKDNSLNISETKYKDVTDIQYLTIGGERAISYKYIKINQNILKKYWVLKNGIEYTFILYKSSNSTIDSANTQIMEKILGSVQFLNSSPTITTTSATLEVTTPQTTIIPTINPKMTTRGEIDIEDGLKAQVVNIADGSDLTVFMTFKNNTSEIKSVQLIRLIMNSTTLGEGNKEGLIEKAIPPNSQINETVIFEKLANPPYRIRYNKIDNSISLELATYNP